MKKYKCSLVNAKKITPDGSIKVLISPTLMGSENLVVGFSELPIGKTIALHVHDYSEEAFFVVNGNGRIFFTEDHYIDFNKGDAVLVPKGVAHRIENNGAETLQVIFCMTPLAPTVELGHREIK